MSEYLNKFKNTLSGGQLLIIILAFVLGWQLGHRDYLFKWQNFKPQISVTNQKIPDKNVDMDFKLFWDTWELLSNKYIDKKAIDPQKLYYGAIQGMVAAVGDPYTVFLPPDAQKATKEQLSGSFEGVGIQLGYNKEKRLVVIAPLKDTPAEKAGVKAGDLILKINDKDATSLSLPEAVSLIRGPKGTAVNLALFRENETKPRDISINRDTIVVKTVVYEQKFLSNDNDLKLLSGDNETKTVGSTADAKKDNPNVETKTTPSGKAVAYIRISGFGEKTRVEWDEAVSEALSRAPQGVVVDVRNNPGGFLDAAVYVASEFLEKGPVVLQEDAQGRRQEQGVIRTGKFLKLPVVVLINKGSASASEILAGAIQDHKRGKLVGETSFGKGTIQSAEDLPEGTGIHITTAKWLTPNGSWVHDNGLKPDYEVVIGEEQNGKEVDSQLDKALELLN